MTDLNWNTGLRPFGVPLIINITALIWPLIFMSHGIMAIPLSLILLLSVAAHEYGHVWAAQKLGAGTSQVVLHGLGGAAFTDTPYCLMPPSAEIKIAAAGPAVSALLAGLGYLLFSYVHQDALLAYLFIINAILTVFNLLPIFPMDGGRVLRGALASKYGPKKAVNAAVKVTYVLAAGLLVLALWKGAIMLAIIMGLIAFMAKQEKDATLRILDAIHGP